MAREYEIIHKEIVDADGITCYIKTGEIVRCKDCIFRKHPDSFESHEGMCPFLNTDEWDDDFYCGYGERKANG